MAESRIEEMTQQSGKLLIPFLYSTSIHLVTIIFICIFVTMPVPGKSQGGREDVQKTETVKYFKTSLGRRDLLEDEITAEEAENANHFRAVYNLQGELKTIEFIPNADNKRKRIKKRELFPKPKPPFRYYESWNPHTKNLEKEIPEHKVGDRPFHRASFLDSTHVKSVEYFRRRNRLLWTYYITWDTNKLDSKLSIVFSTRLPITTLDPHLFHPTASEMRPGWIADFRHNRLGRPLHLTVHDAVGNVYYFYQFKHRFETVGDTLNPITYRITTSEYYWSDSTLMGSHRLIFTATNNLSKKEYFDSRGQLTETIEYTYDPGLQEVSVLIRDPKGNIIHREVRSKNSN